MKETILLFLFLSPTFLWAQEKLDGVVQIDMANSTNNNSPGITVKLNDDFLYDGQYLNHYGLGFHNFKDNSSTLNGRNAYLSGYFGVDFFTSGKNRLRINFNGNIGIGKVNPSQKLDVNGNVKISTTGGSDRLLQIENVYRTWNLVANGYDFVIKDSNDAEDWLRIDGNHNWLKLGGESFYLNSAGNLGIGTTTPSAKLDVAGNIKAQEIEVTLASMQDLNLNGTLAANNITYTANGQTADHVFEENYNLQTLAEVESFIQENKHLPDIPSAVEMEEEGVNLAEMNKLLLQKVEELTLYAIQKDKQVKYLVQEVDSQTEKVDYLEKRLAKLETLIINE